MLYTRCYIESNAFANNKTNLAEVVINHQATILSDAFNSCLSLRKIYIGPLVSVYDRAFINCANATIVTAKAEGTLAHLIRSENGSTTQTFPNIVYNTSYEDYLTM